MGQAGWVLLRLDWPVRKRFRDFKHWSCFERLVNVVECFVKSGQVLDLGMSVRKDIEKVQFK